jgi:hypothetical protein
MASPSSEIVSAQYAPNTQTALYTSPAGVWTRIESLSVCNTTGGPVNISINLVPSGGSVGGSNLTTYQQAILGGQTWNSPNEYGKYLNQGDALSVLASAASSLVITVAGTQITG